MKHYFLTLLLATLVMAGCTHRTNDLKRIATADPIIPIRLNCDTQTIYLTDYVPLLMTTEMRDIDWVAGDQLELLIDSVCLAQMDSGQMPEYMRIVSHERTIQLFYFYREEDGFTLPVLPNKPVAQTMVLSAANQGEVTISFLQPARGQRRLYAFIQNDLVAWDHVIANADDTYTITVAPMLKGRSYLRVYAEDDSTLYNDLLIPLQDGQVVTSADLLTRHDHEAQVLYSLMIDRFCNGNPANDWHINDPDVLDIVDYQGGDIAGITHRIEEGFFDSLGINTIWISPITQNPLTAWGRYPFAHGCKYDSTRTFTRFSGYHGYWPIYSTALDSRFATDEEFRQLLTTAHKHHINVILDYVANHLHIDAPVYREHPDWHTDSILPDGRRNFELWDEQRLTTWFDVHIPTLDLEREEVCESMTDSALYWLEHYDLDGYRHDACKHIPEGYWRLLVQKMARRYPGRSLWMIGETYGGPDLINRYVRTGMLNAQFDFNIYWSARDALCYGASFENIHRTILTSLSTYGSHHTMGNISGNHDQPRITSLADGAVSRDEDSKEAGWTRVIRPATDLAYTRAMQLEVLNMTLPGVPCIYQGDEYAEIGGNDPDNRHMLRTDNLSAEEQQFRERVRQLINMRRHSMALNYGEYIPVKVTADTLQYQRVYLNEVIDITLIRDEESIITHTTR